MPVVIGGDLPGVVTWAGRSGAVVPTKTDVGLGNVDNTTDAGKAVSTAQQTALNLKADAIDSGLVSGNYYYAGSPGVATTAAVAAGSLRLCPFMLRKPVTLTRLAAEIVTAGDAGSKLRLGIYADTGNNYPGALIIDAGQIAGDSATVQELTISQLVSAGLVWFAAVAQSVTTTPPTVRYANSGWTPPVPITTGSALPAANSTGQGYAYSGVTGALPASIPAGQFPAGGVPRLIFKVA